MFLQLFAFADLFVACQSAETYSVPCWCTNGQLQETSAAQAHPILSILQLTIKPHESCFIAWRLFPVYMATWVCTWLQQGPAEGDAGCEEEVQSRSAACGGQSRAVEHLSPSCTAPGHAEPAQDCRPSRSVPQSDLVPIGLLYTACPNGCRHHFTFLPRLRPYPVKEHRLLYHASVSTVHASNAACVHVQCYHQRQGSKAALNMRVQCDKLADVLPGLAHALPPGSSEHSNAWHAPSFTTACMGSA